MFNYFTESLKDVIGHLRPLFQRGACYVREDGKIGIKGKNVWDVPWVYTVPEEDRNCIIPKTVLFPYYGFIPSRCHKCWKVVVRPQTLSELFKLYELQKRLGLSSKVGIEDRPIVEGVYGGYFYNDSLEEGLACKIVVERLVSSEIGLNVSVILKRGCTEYEHKHPNPDTWRITEQQKETEADLADLLILETKKVIQTDYIIRNVKRKWVERACEVGDETYREFTGGRSLYPSIKTYAQEGDNAEKESIKEIRI